MIRVTRGHQAIKLKQKGGTSIQARYAPLSIIVQLSGLMFRANKADRVTREEGRVRICTSSRMRISASMDQKRRIHR